MLETWGLLSLVCLLVLAIIGTVAFIVDQWRQEPGQPDVGLAIFDPPGDYCPPLAQTVRNAREWDEKLAAAARAGEFAAALSAAFTAAEKAIIQAGRHRAVGPRDPRIDNMLTTTQQFDAFVELETGKRPHGKGPAEVDIRYTRTEVSAQQLALDLGVLR